MTNSDRSAPDSRRSFVSRILGRLASGPRALAEALFGFDFFISYAHRDGYAYPAALARALEAEPFRFQAHLDTRDYEAGQDLRLLTRLRVGNSRMLVVVARRGALEESEWVLREVHAFERRGRTPLIIDVAGSVSRSRPSEGRLSGWIAGHDEILRIDDPGPEGADREPPTAVIEKVAFSFRGARKRETRVRVISAALVAFVLLSAAAIWLAVAATRARNVALSRQVAAQSGVAAVPEAAMLLALASASVQPTHDSWDALLRAFDRSPKLETVFHGHRRGVRALAFDGARGRIAAGDEDGALWLWPAQSPYSGGRRIQESGSAISALHFTDAGLLLAGDADGTVRIWRPDGMTADVAGVPLPNRWTSRVTEDWSGAADPEPPDVRGARRWLAFASRGIEALAADASGRVFRIDLHRAELAGEPIESGVEDPDTLDWRPEAGRALIGGADGRVAEIDLNRGQVDRLVELGPESVLLARYLDTGVVAVSSEGRVSVLGPTLQPVSEDWLPGRRSFASADYRAADGRFAVAGFDGEIDLFELDGGSIVGRTALAGGHASIASAVALSSGGSAPGLATSADVTGRVVLWNPRKSHPLLTEIGSVEEVALRSIAFSTPSRLTATGVAEGRIVRVEVDVARGVAKSPERTSCEAGVDLAASSDGRRVAIVSAANRLVVRSTDCSAPALFERSLDQTPTRLRFDRSGRYFAAGMRDGAVLAFDLDAGRRILAASPESLGDMVSALAWSPSAGRLAAGSLQGSIGLWRLRSRARGSRSGRFHLAAEAHHGPVFALSFSTHGATVISTGGGGDRDVQVWSGRTLAPLRLFAEAHATSSGAAGHSPDGALLATASDDGVVLLWRAPDYRRLATGLLAGERSGNVVEGLLIEDLVFSPDSRRLAALAGGQIFVWNLDPDFWKETACRVANREMRTAEWEAVLGRRRQPLLCRP